LARAEQELGISVVNTPEEAIAAVIGELGD
jgi:hypothetical protein